MILKSRISLICDHRDPYKCDRCILNLVRQQLMQTDENIPKLNQKQQILTRLKQVFDCLGVIIVTSQGQVLFITQRGEQLLNQYFDQKNPDSLPETLQHWFQHEILSLPSDSQVSFFCLPLQIEKKGKQLLISLIANLIGE